MNTEDGRVGCMMCNTAVELAPYDSEAKQKVEAHRAHLRERFRAKLSEARDAGEIGRESDLGALAEFLTTTAYSLGFLIRSGSSDAQVRRHLNTALSALR